MGKGKGLEKALRELEAIEHDILEAAREGTRQIGFEAQELMVDYLSGKSVAGRDGTFLIQVRTGNLRRHVRMEYPLRGDDCAVAIFNNASYAREIEEGISGDDKRDKILYGGSPAKMSKKGKAYRTIPGGPGSLMKFWTITEDSQLSDQAPRPFVQTVVEHMQPRAESLLSDAIMRKIEG